MASLLFLISWSICGCSTHGSGTAFIRVVDPTGAPIPGVGVKTGNMVSYSDRLGTARFNGLSAGKHSFDSKQAGMMSCGPKILKVRSEGKAEGVLMMRIGAMATGIVIGPDGDATTAPSFEDIEFKACPGRPDSAITIRLSGPEPAH